MDKPLDKEDLDAIAGLTMYVKSNMDSIGRDAVDRSDREKILASTIDPKRVVRSAIQPVLDIAQNLVKKVDENTAQPVPVAQTPPPMPQQPPPLPTSTHVQLELFASKDVENKTFSIEEAFKQLHADNIKIIELLSKIEAKSITKKSAAIKDGPV